MYEMVQIFLKLTTNKFGSKKFWIYVKIKLILRRKKKSSDSLIATISQCEMETLMFAFKFDSQKYLIQTIDIK